MAVCASQVVLLSLLLAGGGETGAIEVGAPLWSGCLDALARPQGERRDLLELAPGGKGFLYIQGAPWRRVMYKAIDPAEEPPRMLGAVAPFGSRPPRFAPAGDWVYFTAVEESSALPPSSAAAPRPGVVRVAFPSLALAQLYPEKGSPTETFAVLLDVHPAGGTLLIGTGNWPRARQAAGGDYELEVAELPASGGSPRPLGFRIGAGAAARYGGGGRWIDYSAAADSDPKAGARLSIHRYERSQKSHRLLDSGPARLAVAAGDLEVTSVLPPHRGSFGWDGFPTYLAAEPGEAAHWLPLRFARETLSLSGTPPVPAGFRSGRVLLAGGFEDRLVLMVAPFSLKKGAAAATADPLAQLFFEPRFLSGELLAQAGNEARPLLLAMARSLHPAPKTNGGAEARREGPQALAATFVEQSLGAAVGPEIRVEVLELSPGYLRVERFYQPPPPPPPAAGQAREAETPEATSEVALFDGKRCTLKTRADELLELAPEAFAREVDTWSLFRLLLDPALLGEPRLAFGGVTPLAVDEAGGRDLRRLAFSYDDGFRGELVVEVAGERVLPTSIRTPLLFPSQRLRREAGNAPAEKELSFGDWREWEGRLVPHLLRFEDGANPRAVALLRLEARNDVGLDAFRAPGG